MLHEVAGDILFSKAQVVVHGIAPYDHFASGLALGLRERWPALYQDFRHYCHQHNPKSGTLWLWGGPGGVRIVNLFTQEAAPNHQTKPGRATLQHINHTLRELRQLIIAEHFSSIALPRLATGVGGMQWAQVFPLIKQYLGDLGIPVFIYTTFRPGVPAQEDELAKPH